MLGRSSHNAIHGELRTLRSGQAHRSWQKADVVGGLIMSEPCVCLCLCVCWGGGGAGNGAPSNIVVEDLACRDFEVSRYKPLHSEATGGGPQGQRPLRAVTEVA